MGNQWEGAREQRRQKTDGAAPGGAVQKNRQAGDESDSAGKPREENREKRHRKGNRNTAERGMAREPP